MNASDSTYGSLLQRSDASNWASAAACWPMLTFSMPLSFRTSASQFGGGVTCVVPLEHLGSVPFAAQNAFLQAVVLSQSFCAQSFTGGGGLLLGFGFGFVATFSHLSFATSSA